MLEGKFPYGGFSRASSTSSPELLYVATPLPKEIWRFTPLPSPIGGDGGVPTARVVPDVRKKYF